MTLPAAVSPWRPRPMVVLTISAVALLLLLLGCILVFPGFLVDHDLGGRPKSTLKTPDLLKATNDIRTTLLQGFAGAFFLVTAFFTWRQIRVSQNQLVAAEDQQINERYTKAIDQLASESVDVRIGGIYALGRVAEDSERDCEVVREVLSAFLRQHAPWPPPPGVAVQPRTTVPPLVHAAMAVLVGGRAVSPSGGPRLNLCGVDLRGVNLRRAKLRNTLLNDSNLSAVHLEGADLRGVRLVHANLQGAWLSRADLRDARLIDAQLQRVTLFAADLRNADLTKAKVDGARFIKTKLQGAKLRGVDLDAARYGGLAYDETTQWNDNFTPRPDDEATREPADEATG